MSGISYIPKTTRKVLDSKHQKKLNDNNEDISFSLSVKNLNYVDQPQFFV